MQLPEPKKELTVDEKRALRMAQGRVKSVTMSEYVEEVTKEQFEPSVKQKSPIGHKITASFGNY